VIVVINYADGLTVAEESDLIAVRHKVRSYAKDSGMGLVDETKLITAASELARNMLVYAGGGRVVFENTSPGERCGVRIQFEDRGPGIADLDLALTDGYSTSKSLGFGLPGARRLVDDFEISSKVGEGTRVVITKWKR
jgi:serine/threonine-protein kinase RsbT